MHTLDVLLPTLLFLASTSGAGFAAFWLFARAREALPAPVEVLWRVAPSWMRLIWSLLYAPAYARFTVFALAALISVLANGLAAWITGQPVEPALDAALAVIASQIVHAGTLSDMVQRRND